MWGGVVGQKAVGGRVAHYRVGGGSWGWWNWELLIAREEVLAVVVLAGATYVHKEDEPSPVLVIKCKWGSSLDEEGNEDLYPFDDSLNGGVGQLAAPYLKVSILACVALDQLSGRLEVFGRSVILNMCIESGGLVKGLCRLMT